MPEYESGFIVISKKHLAKLANQGSKTEEAVNWVLSELAMIEQLIPKNEYYVCSKDEPYAGEVLAAILRGERKKTFQNFRVPASMTGCRYTESDMEFISESDMEFISESDMEFISERELPSQITSEIPKVKRIKVEVINDIFGNSIFWEGPAENIDEIKNIPAKRIAEKVAEFGGVRQSGMWLVSAVSNE